jgi:hypothetical protein
MLAVVEDARAVAGNGHAAWSESFSEMFTGGQPERRRLAAERGVVRVRSRSGL